MEQGKFCDGCSHADDCKMIYEQLGRTEGPPVALNALLVFVAPVVVFIGALGVFGALLRGRVSETYQTPLTFLLALSIATGTTLGISAIVKRHHKSR